MARRWLSLLLLLVPAATAAVFNVRSYGAAGDGKRKDTAAIQKAIAAAAAAGGGVAYVPPGRYLTGAIELKSFVTLELEAGATLLASEDPRDYPLRESAWGDGHKGISALIYADGQQSIALRGRGTVDGQGAIWWKRHALANPRAKMPKPTTPEEIAEAKAVANGRPHLVNFVRSRQVLIDGLTFVNSPSWTIHPLLCEHVVVNGVTIVNPEPSPNTDGINPEACRYVRISNCLIDAGDDCITLKSGKDELGRRMGKPDEDITITNCTMLHGHAAVAIGSEMSGGVRNVAVSNCVFHGTDRGVRMKTQRGRGGLVEGITFSNIVMQDVGEAINIVLYYSGGSKVDDAAPVDEGTPRFRDILISNITARGSKSAGQIVGLKEMPIEGVTFSNVRLQAEKGLKIHNARDIVLHDVELAIAAGEPLTVTASEGVDRARVRVKAREK